MSPRPRASPAATARPASTAVRLPLNLSGATTIRIGSVQQRDGGRRVLAADRELFELCDVVELGAHRDVRDPLEDDFDDNRYAELGHGVLGLLEGRQDLV